MREFDPEAPCESRSSCGGSLLTPSTAQPVEGVDRFAETMTELVNLSTNSGGKSRGGGWQSELSF
jgi:hypothetical protein